MVDGDKERENPCPISLPTVKEVMFNNAFYHRTSKTLEAYVLTSKYNSEAVFQLS